MCIEIKYEKFVSETGELMVRINKIKALGVERLPEEYLSGFPLAYFERKPTGRKNNRETVDALHIEWEDGDGYERVGVLSSGFDMAAPKFNKLMKIAEKAGKRLMKINKKNRKKAKKGWQGQETLKI